MKKYLYSVLVMALFAIGFAASDDSGSSNVVSEEAPTSMESVTAEQMLSDLEQNPMRAQKLYSDKWFEIVGTLGNMDSEGEYFSLEGPDFSLISVQCQIPRDKKEEFTNKLITTPSTAICPVWSEQASVWPSVMACPSLSPRRRAASAAPRKPRTSKYKFNRWARPAPAHRKKSRAMTREVRKAVTRIRRVQDAVYNNKVGICHSMSIHTNTLVRCDGEVMT